jgi:predicted ester cyclase
METVMHHLGTSVAVLVAGLSVATSAAAQTRTKIEETNVETVMQFYGDGWGARPGWEEVWRANMSPDVRMFFHAFPPTEGIETAITFNRDLFGGFPDLQVKVEEVIAEGDMVVVRGRLTGQHEGTFLGIPATGAKVDVPDVTMYRFDGGKVVESRYFTDLMAVMTAIGAIPKLP